MRNIPVALAIFTVGDELNKEYYKTLEKIKQIGYDYIEIGGFGAFNTKEWNRTLDELELEIISNHIGIEMLEQSFNHVAEFNLEIGVRNLVVPYIREERRIDADSYKRVAESLNIIGSKCNANGMKLHYHNHSFEFAIFDGKTGHQILIENTDPKYVSFQLDTYWLYHGGQNPKEYIKTYGSRVRLIHLKDMLDDEKKSFAEVGEGILNFNEIFKEADQSNTEYFIVEQDVCRRHSLESIRLSIENIKRIKVESAFNIT